VIDGSIKWQQVMKVKAAIAWFDKQLQLFIRKKTISFYDGSFLSVFFFCV